MKARHPISAASGFTLIELSIVLVIIGLIVGAVLVGKDLIHAAEIRAQVSQFDKYQTAVNAFELKYNCLPGDCKNAADFGFAARGAGIGQGDGNGIIDGTDGSGHCSECVFSGEENMFWVDLSQAGLISGTYIADMLADTPDHIKLPIVANYLPAAKIGGGNYIYVWNANPNETVPLSGYQNYFGLSAVIGSSDGGGYSPAASNMGLTPPDAYALDNKMDDGLPQTGKMIAIYAGFALWAIGGHNNPQFGVDFGNGDSDPTTGSTVVAGDGILTPPTPDTCYDNGGVGGIEHYTVAANGLNCALSLRF